MKGTGARRAAIVIGLFVVLFGTRFVLDDPTYVGATFLLVLPTVLAALWFGLWGGVAVAVAASIGFFLAEVGVDEETLRSIVWATLVRLAALVLVAVLVARLFARQLALARELDEAEAVRDALRPAAVAARPSLELAAHYVPAEQGVGPPLRLDDGLPLDSAGAGQPLGLDEGFELEGASAPLSDTAGVLLYTDGILDARDGSAERFGAERLQSLVASHGGDGATALVEQLRAALAAYAPAGGDDVCLLAARNLATVGSSADG
jgi:NhaP-type Na+/H+ or K+/H+ antiporter